MAQRQRHSLWKTFGQSLSMSFSSLHSPAPARAPMKLTQRSQLQMSAVSVSKANVSLKVEFRCFLQIRTFQYFRVLSFPCLRSFLSIPHINVSQNPVPDPRSNWQSPDCHYHLETSHRPTDTGCLSLGVSLGVTRKSQHILELTSEELLVSHSSRP